MASLYRSGHDGHSADDRGHAPFGLEIWSAFLASTKFTRAVVLEQGEMGWHKIQSVFSVVRMWGAEFHLPMPSKSR